MAKIKYIRAKSTQMKLDWIEFRKRSWTHSLRVEVDDSVAAVGAVCVSFHPSLHVAVWYSGVNTVLALSWSCADCWTVYLIIINTEAETITMSDCSSDM